MALCAAAGDSAAVQLNPDGIGQALIYPYYTTRSVQANPFNTYVTVVNTDETARALRVRFREGANGREVASFNLFLGPLDMWAAAIVPDRDGAKVVTPDNSCVVPAMQRASPRLTELAFSSDAYSGANADGAGTGRDRTREGYIEIIEMATVAPSSDTHEAISLYIEGPDDCSYLTFATPQRIAGDMRAPTGGLMGTLTLINVASGEDFTVNAEALAQLTTQHMFRPASDPYPDFDAAEVTPRSTLLAGEKRYLLDWARPVDAVSSVLMQARTEGEYILDNASRSRTDWVFTMPTRRFYRAGATAAPPFGDLRSAGCDTLSAVMFDRETRRSLAPEEYCVDVGCRSTSVPLCHAASLWTADHSEYSPSYREQVFGSTTDAGTAAMFILPDFYNGWLRMRADSAGAAVGLLSLPTSRAIDVNTGANVAGAFRVTGLPLVGFMARTFNNGTLTCASGRCQGNYGSAFPHKAVRSVVGVP